MKAILYVNRTDVPWKYLPHGFPPYTTVHHYYAKREADGTSSGCLLRDKARRAQGRPAAPSAAVIDARSVKTSAHVAEASQGIDADDKIEGRERHVATDALGLVLAVIVTSASVHDSTGGKRLLDELAASHPSVTKVWADGGYQNSVLQLGASRGIDVEVVKRSTVKGLPPQKKRSR